MHPNDDPVPSAAGGPRSAGTAGAATAAGRIGLAEGLSAGRLGYGAMQLPGPGAWGPPKDRGEAVAVLRQAVERGVDHVDTAGFYGPHVANDLICEALHPYADGLVIATKVGVERDGLGAWNPSASPRSLREQVEDNLAACTCPSWTWSTCGSAVTACCRRTRRRGRSRSRR